MPDFRYERIVESIVTRGRFGMKPGLDRICPLLSNIGSPELRFPSIHVVGTNGKGSTGSFLSSILTAAGYRTGFFSSPHLVSYTERFRIDGREIPRERLVELATRVLEASPVEATFFEITTAIALLWFSQEGVDVAVLEAGMGGRHDATAAAPGIMTLVTPISLDHTQWLGATLGEIARDKVGIATPGFPMVSSPQPREVEEVIDAVASDWGSALSLCGRDFDCSWDGEDLWYFSDGERFGPFRPGIGGRYQGVNVAVAVRAALQLSAAGFRITATHLANGVESACWPGRMERFPGSPTLLLDGAHNPAGAEALATELDRLATDVVLLLGVVDDKDVEGVVSLLAPRAETVVTVRPPVERGVDPERLARIVREKGGEPIPTPTVARALDEARKAAGPDGLVVVCGSLYLVGAIRGILTGIEPLVVRG